MNIQRKILVNYRYLDFPILTVGNKNAKTINHPFLLQTSFSTAEVFHIPVLYLCNICAIKWMLLKKSSHIIRGVMSIGEQTNMHRQLWEQ